MPVHAGTGAHDGVVGAVLQNLDTAVGEHQHGAFHVVGDQHIAAAAQHQQRLLGDAREGKYLRQHGRIEHLQQLRGGGVDMERVERLQRGVFSDGPGSHGVVHSGATAPRLGASLRRRIASTQSCTSSGPRKIRPL
ncbi:hypothetical protein D3C71_1430380 [compost metagenome]